MIFEYTDPQTPMERLFGGHCSINAFGRIEPGDGAKFAAFLQRISPPPITCIYLNTPGGSVPDGIEIGRLIRQYGLSTSIGTYVLLPPQERDIVRRREFQPGICASSGTLAFLGGRFRFFQEGSEFRVHQFFFQRSVGDVLGPSQQTSAAIARYLTDMGIDLQLMQIGADVHHTQTRSLKLEELVELGVVALGVSDVTWSTESRNNSIYVRAQRDTIYGLQKLILGYVRTGGFYVHAIFECQGRDQELTAFPLVEVTMNNESIRWDVSSRAARQIMNGFINVFVPVSSEEAREISGSRTFGLQIRFSNLADLFLGIGDMTIDTDGRGRLDTLVSMFA